MIKEYSRGLDQRNNSAQLWFTRVAIALALAVSGVVAVVPVRAYASGHIAVVKQVFPSEAGFSVALSADGNTAVFGAPRRVVNGFKNAGAVVIYRFQSGKWHKQATLTLGSLAREKDYLGVSVAISGDASTLLAGADGRHVNGKANAGGAELYRFNGSKWIRQTELNLGAGANASDSLGGSVSLSTNGNEAIVGEGYRQLAQVFTFNGTTWSAPTALSIAPSDTSTFGTSVSLSGDGNTALVGDYEHSVGSVNDSGSAYVFTLNGNTWSSAVKLNLGAAAHDADMFGYRVALSADGLTAVAGAMNRSVNGKLAGAAFAFKFNGTSWSAAAPLTEGSSAKAEQGLGWSVAVNADGSTVVTGMQKGWKGVGAAQIFHYVSGSWTKSGLLHESSKGAYDFFGQAVATNGLASRALVGIPEKTVSGKQFAGAADVFNKSGSSWSKPVQLNI